MNKQYINLEDCRNNIEYLTNSSKEENSIIQPSHSKETFEEWLEIGNRILGKESEFNSLSYSEKLKFWDSNGLAYNCEFYGVIENKKLEEVDTGIYNGEEFSIFPNTPEEQELQFNWYSKHKKSELEFDLERLKERHNKVLSSSPDPITYVQEELNKLERTKEMKFKTAEREKKWFNGLNSSTRFQSYQRAYESEVKALKFYLIKGERLEDFEQILAGKVDAHYIPFLRNELKRLVREDKQPNERKVEIEEELPTIRTSTKGQKVMIMYELGIFEFLYEKLQKENPSKNSPKKLAQIVNSFTGMEVETIRRSYSAIILQPNDKNNPYNNPKNKEFIIETFKTLGLNRIGKK